MRSETIHILSISIYLIANHLQSDREVTAVFQRIVNKRFLPDYHEIIKEPIAFSTIRVRSCQQGYFAFTNMFQREKYSGNCIPAGENTSRTSPSSHTMRKSITALQLKHTGMHLSSESW